MSEVNPPEGNYTLPHHPHIIDSDDVILYPQPPERPEGDDVEMVALNKAIDDQARQLEVLERDISVLYYNTSTTKDQYEASGGVGTLAGDNPVEYDRYFAQLSKLRQLIVEFKQKRASLDELISRRAKLLGVNNDTQSPETSS